jgi:signal transduction histidine kinase
MVEQCANVVPLMKNAARISNHYLRETLVRLFLMAKPHQIKALSDLRGFGSLLMDLRLDVGRDEIGKLILDLSFVTAVDAVGLAVLLARLADFSKQQRYDQFELIAPRISEINNTLDESGATNMILAILNQSVREASARNLELFPQPSNEPIVTQHATRKIRRGYVGLIAVDTCGGKSRHDLVVDVRQQLRNAFATIRGNQFNEAQIHIVVAELVKNTVDHSGSRAFIGVDVKLDSGDKCESIRLAYVDTGNGISQSVRSFLAKQLQLLSPQPAELTRKIQKGSASEFIRDAFTPDFTTKPNNGVNFGIGLSLIQRGIKGAGFSGLLLDAQSAINITSFDVTETLSHEEIRRGSCRILGNPPLTFVIEWSRTS